jgi:hypothetical protein
MAYLEKIIACEIDAQDLDRLRAIHGSDARVPDDPRLASISRPTASGPSA